MVKRREKEEEDGLKRFQGVGGEDGTFESPDRRGGGRRDGKTQVFWT